MTCAFKSSTIELSANIDVLSRLFTIKGAPDILITRCTHILGPDGETRPLSEDVLRKVEGRIQEWSSDGKRVLLLARKVLAQDGYNTDPSLPEYEAQMLREAKTGLTLVCVVGLIDSPRSEIPEVIRLLRQAQIRVFMVLPSFNNSIPSKH
jgi:sodium/potassium-transporting ATPase subunit alpha